MRFLESQFNCRFPLSDVAKHVSSIHFGAAVCGLQFPEQLNSNGEVFSKTDETRHGCRVHIGKSWPMHKTTKVRRLLLKAAQGCRLTSPNAELKHGDTYALPDGTKVVVGACREGRRVLYHPLVWAGKTWIVNMPVAYEIDADGRLCDGAGRPTLWRVEDLTVARRTI